MDGLDNSTHFEESLKLWQEAVKEKSVGSKQKKRCLTTLTHK